MPTLIESPRIIPSPGDAHKHIAEFIGVANTKTPDISIAYMRSAAGWHELGQTPEFDEYSLVLRGMLRVESAERVMDVRAGQGVIAKRGEWVRYSSPEPGGAEYVAVCIPAFSPDIAHRDA